MNIPAEPRTERKNGNRLKLAGYVGYIASSVSAIIGAYYESNMGIIGSFIMGLSSGIFHFGGYRKLGKLNRPK